MLFSLRVFIASVVGVLLLAQHSIGQEKPSRIISIGGSVTEIVFALGEQERLIGRDSTSVHPESVFALPDVGYMRQLSPEGVLTLNPDMILMTEGSGPPESIAVLEASSVKLVEIPNRFGPQGIIEKIQAVGDALDVPDKTANLVAKTTRDLEKTAKLVANVEMPKRVLFILSMRGGKVMAAGADSAAFGILEMAGAESVFTDYPGYKQVTDEAVITANPEVILMMNRHGSESSQSESLFNHPAIAPTTAGKHRRIIKMDGSFLLGFGPRSAAAALELARNLYGDLIPAN